MDIINVVRNEENDTFGDWETKGKFGASAIQID